ncbi:D-alanyl-D-alanine carboxypeptidase-like protein [Mumia flava]|uniref:D-alanyl-D-alanine carboxypeptidase-like protein n=1 Tax=Mumia flava TaxID=1348852 RepID=A0A2M9BID3_9ACTN|nr:D-alanyl-D-alanine carboxypeptidase-like protein [Mumia flava]
MLVAGLVLVMLASVPLVRDWREAAAEHARAEQAAQEIASEALRRERLEEQAVAVSRSLHAAGRARVGRQLVLTGCPSEQAQPSGPNGRLPASALCTVDGIELRADAAEAWARLEEDFRAAFGRSPCVNNGYRSYAQQASMYAANPGLVAAPGTSNHGLGLAVDLCGAEEGPGSSTWTWLDSNGPAYGWGLPSWARPGGSRAEPWHFEYLAAGGDRVQ